MWNLIHKYITNNYYYEYYENFRYPIVTFLQHIDDFKNKFRTCLKSLNISKRAGDLASSGHSGAADVNVNLHKD